jgi:rare lipoprotein A
MRWLIVCGVALLITACSTPSRYQQDVDSTPVYKEIIQRLPEPIPVREPLSRRGNPDQYEVWGQTYQVSKGLKQYKEMGVASWYGQKFHGHDTSNGERFDVYEFTAAHKSLPLPAYVKVTNLDNQKSLVVRVNDRGPFHENRLIDLSYAAAVRLGFADSGTANVEVEMLAAPITDVDYQTLQVGAFSAPDRAQKVQQQIAMLINENVYVNKESQGGKILHKVRIGPISPNRLDAIQNTLLQNQYKSGLVLP